MIDSLLGIKKNMTSTYDARGRRVGATVISLGPNFVTQVKSTETKDGYNAIQLGFGAKKSVKKPQIGTAKKAGLDQQIRWFREVKTTAAEVNLNPGQQISVSDIFSVGDIVKVTGTSKGKGFAGVVKRYGFHGGPKTHGQSDRHRAPGSIGSGTTPGRVYKGKKMGGHMGSDKVSVKNLEVVGLDKQANLLIIKGGIPGANGSLVTVKKLGVVKGYTPPPEEKIEEEVVTEQSATDNASEAVVEQPQEEVVAVEQSQPVSEEGVKENA